MDLTWTYTGGVDTSLVEIDLPKIVDLNTALDLSKKAILKLGVDTSEIEVFDNIVVGWTLTRFSIFFLLLFGPFTPPQQVAIKVESLSDTVTQFICCVRPVLPITADVYRTSKKSARCLAQYLCDEYNDYRNGSEQF